MHPVLRFFNRLLTLILLVTAVVLGGLYFLKVQFDKPGPLQADAVTVIPQGKGVSEIADQLESDGIIADRRLFVATVLYFNTLKRKISLKAGEYEFGANASMRDVLDKLVEGKAIQHKVTIAEGLTSRQVVQKLLEDPELTGEIAEVPPEGSLLPDTYLYTRGTSRQAILDQMRQAQQLFLAKAWAARHDGLAIETQQQALILASIVEKETAIDGERPQIAAVFHNRLKKGMRLQSDPTIIYGLVGGQGSLGRPILQSELDKKTEYNTYQIDGLPPTPIANPGREAIIATLQPAETTDLYFVADGTGGHAFSATLKEHNNNVAKWRKVQRQLAEEAKKKAEAAAAAATTDTPALDEDAARSLLDAGGEPPAPVRKPDSAGQ